MSPKRESNRADGAVDPSEIREEILRRYPPKVAKRRAKTDSCEQGGRAEQVPRSWPTRVPSRHTHHAGCAYAGCKGVVLGPTREILADYPWTYWMWLLQLAYQAKSDETQDTGGHNFMPYACPQTAGGGDHLRWKKKLKKAIEEAVEIFHPKAIGIFSTCPRGSHW